MIPCKVCGNPATIEVTNVHPRADSGSYCRIHGPKLFAPLEHGD